MMKFVQTDYWGTKNILRFVDHYVTMPIMVDDTGVIVNADGKKIVPAGTIVGGDVFANPTNAVREANTPAIADLVCAGENNDITVTAKVFKTLKVALIDPAANDQVLSVSVTGDTINVSLATGPAGAITSTANDVIALLNTSLITSSLITAAKKGEDTGAGVVTALAAISLANGSVHAPEGVLFNDVDVTYGPAPGAMLIHGFPALDKLPVEPDAVAVTALAGRIVFLK
jgi:hypothetical protein